MCVYMHSVCAFHVCMHDHIDQKKALSPLEIQVVLNFPMWQLNSYSIGQQALF